MKFHKWHNTTPNANKIIPLLMKHMKIRTALDIGCGLGYWYTALKQHGISSKGIDGSWAFHNPKLQIQKENFITHNLNEEFTKDIGTFDLVLCLETAEHIHPKHSDSLCDFISSRGNVILFSAAIPYQGGNGHVNEQWQSYWVHKFHDRGFIHTLYLRSLIWKDTSIFWWYRQNIILYIKESHINQFTFPIEKKEIDVVHPDAWVNRNKE